MVFFDGTTILIDIGTRAVSFAYRESPIAAVLPIVLIIYRAYISTSRDKAIVERLLALESKPKMFPLAQKEIGGYKFGQRTWYTSKHLGVDYKANKSPLVAPFDGVIVNTLKGFQGGLTIWYKPNHDNVVMRFLHLDKIEVSKGQNVSKGQRIGTTGNTGFFSTGPHLHLDISRGNVNLGDFNNFLDPESYNWDWEPSQPASQPSQPFTVIQKFRSNWRNQPTTKSPIYATYPAGTRVRAIEEVDGDVVTVNGESSNKWIKSAKSGKFIHSLLVNRE